MTKKNYNHLGSHITGYCLSDLFPDENGMRVVFNINESSLQIINKVHKNQDKVIWRASATGMENHYNTHCSGANSIPILFTSEECPVSPFLPEYSEQMNIPIFVGVTALTLNSEDFMIL